MLAVYALNYIAQKRFGKLYADCTPEEQEIVQGAFRFGNYSGPNQVESMNIKEIAHKLMALREGMSAFIMSGKLREALGFDGYGEALTRRWVVPDQEGSGMLQVTNDLGTVAEMRQLADEYVKEEGEACTFCHKKGDECECQKCPDCKKANCTCESMNEGKKMSWTTFKRGNLEFHYDDEGKLRKGPSPKDKSGTEKAVQPSGETEFFSRKDWQVKTPPSARESAHHVAVSHAFRPKPSLTEIATMGLGNPERLGTPPTQPSVRREATAAQPLATTAEPAKKESVNVGSNVRVVQDGKTYVGRISAVKPDGKFQISFGGPDKPPVERSYDKTEVSPVADDVQK